MRTVVRRLVIWAVFTAAFIAAAAFVQSCQRTPSGDPKAYDVQRADVTVDVQPDASLLVTERLTFEYSGSFSGAYRDIPLQEGVEMSDITLADRVEGTYRPGGSTTLGSSDDPGKVGTEDLEGDGGQGGKRIVWHYDQQDGTREFTLRYRIRGAAKAYGDALVVPWAVWGDQWDFWLEHLTARIRVPEPASGDGRPLEAWMRPDDRAVTPELSAQGATIELDRSKPLQQVTLTAAFKPESSGAPRALSGRPAAAWRRRAPRRRRRRAARCDGSRARWRRCSRCSSCCGRRCSGSPRRGCSVPAARSIRGCPSMWPGRRRICRRPSGSRSRTRATSTTGSCSRRCWISSTAATSRPMRRRARSSTCASPSPIRGPRSRRCSPTSDRCSTSSISSLRRAGRASSAS